MSVSTNAIIVKYSYQGQTRMSAFQNRGLFPWCRLFNSFSHSFCNFSVNTSDLSPSNSGNKSSSSNGRLFPVTNILFIHHIVKRENMLAFKTGLTSSFSSSAGLSFSYSFFTMLWARNVIRSHFVRFSTVEGKGKLSYSIFTVRKRDNLNEVPSTSVASYCMRRVMCCHAWSLALFRKKTRLLNINSPFSKSS